MELKGREVAHGLRFPEGPVWLPGGSVLVVEIAGGALTRISPSGKAEVVAKLGGGPNGAALGPDGAVADGYRPPDRHRRKLRGRAHRACGPRDRTRRGALP
jgi:hypothetical protein